MKRVTLPRLRWLAIAAYLGLLALVIAWEGFVAPSRYAPPAFWTLLKALPLIAPLYFLWREKANAYLIAGLLVLLYFIEGVVVSFSERQTPGLSPLLACALLEVTLSVVFVFSAMLYVRGQALMTRNHV